MWQPDLWGSESLTIVDDATGRIRRDAAFLAAGEAAALFEVLRTSIPWVAAKRTMYDRVVAVPRLVAHFGRSATLPPPLRELRTRVERACGTRFTSVGLNFYRDERDSVAWHSDDVSAEVPLATVALVSLGAQRRMLVRPKRRPRVTHEIDLASGSLLVMAGAAQLHWEHAIPKEREPVGGRISVAFRQSVSGG